LRGEECAIEDWNHAQQVWNSFGCKDFQDYHELYLKSMPSQKHASYFHISI